MEEKKDALEIGTEIRLSRREIVPPRARRFSSRLDGRDPFCREQVGHAVGEPS